MDYRSNFEMHISKLRLKAPFNYNWHRDVMVITTAQLHSTKPELRFCSGSNTAHSMWEIRDGEDL